MVVGWAVGDDGGELVKFGLIRPDRRRGRQADRIEGLARSVVFLCSELVPNEAVIEVPSGHVNDNRHHGRGSGLSIYGWAVGEIVASVRHWSSTVCGFQLNLVSETEWLQHVQPDNRTKAARVERMRLLNPLGYKDAADPGGDICDAIDILWWWVTERKIRQFIS